MKTERDRLGSFTIKQLKVRAHDCTAIHQALHHHDNNTQLQRLMCVPQRRVHAGDQTNPKINYKVKLLLRDDSRMCHTYQDSKIYFWLCKLQASISFPSFGCIVALHDKTF